MRSFIVLLTLVCVPCFAEIPISGRIVDQKKMPVAKAEITLTPILNPLQRAQPEMYTQGRSAAIALSVTNQTGNYKLQAPSAGLWMLRVDAAGFVPIEFVLTPLLEDYDSGDVTLAKDEGLDVQVLDPARKPVEAALVRVEDEDQRDFYMNKPWKRAVRTSATGKDGKAHLPRAGGESLLISVSADGYNFAELHNIHGSMITIPLAPGTKQTVQVTEMGGASVPGVLLALGEAGHPVDISDAKGEVKAAIERGKSAKAMLYSPDGRVYRWNWIGAEPTDKPVVIRLPKRTGIRGRVIDAETAEVIKSAFVWDTGQRWNHSDTTNGDYHLTLPAGSTWLRCKAAGYAEKNFPDFIVAPDAETEMTIALQPASAIEGVVLDPEGQPVANAELFLEAGMRFRGQIRYFPYLARKLRAKQNGTFRISELDVKRVYRITARSQSFANASAEFDFAKGAQSVKGIRLQFKAGLSATGVIVDASDVPIPGAVIKVFESAVESSSFMMPMDTPELRSTTADENGAFHLEGLAPGKFDLEISAPRFATKRVPGVEVKPQNGPQDFGRIALDAGFILMGRVQDQQKHPIQGAQIRIGPPDPNGFTGRLVNHDPDAVSSDDGSFQIADQSDGAKVDISVTHEGYLDLELSATTISGAQPLLLTLSAASQISGKIVNESGQPISGAAVTLMQMSRGNLMATGNDANSQDDGSFVLKTVSADTYSLAVKAPGWQDTLEQGVVVVEGKDTTGLKIVLKPEALLEGMVTTPEGKAAIGALVEMSVQNERFNRGQRSSATADGEGNYQLHGLKPGTVNIQVSLEEYPRLVKEIDIKEGSNHMDFQLAGGNDISGRVIDETGAPVATAYVTLFMTGNIKPAITDNNGVFTLKGVPDGDYQLRIDAEGLAPDDEKNMVHVAGAPVQGLIVQMHHGTELTGNIIGLNPDQFSQVEVEVWKMPSYYFHTHVDAKGMYRFAGLAAGRWSVTGTLAGGSSASAEISLEPGMKQASLDLKFGEGLKLKGIVLRGNDPQPGLQIEVSGKDTDSGGYSSTDAAGKFQIDGLQRGIHTITVYSNNGKLNYKQTVDMGQGEQEIVIRIPESHIRGKVTDASDGSVLAGVSITVLSTTSEMESPSATTSSADSGAFEIPNIASGDWKLSFKKDGYAPAVQTIHLEADQEMDNVNVALQPAEGLTLQVQMAGGQPPARVVVAPLDAAGNALFIADYATGEAGRVHLKSLPAGKWELLAYIYGSAVTDIDVTVPQSNPVVVVLNPGGTVHIHVPAIASEKIIAKATFKSPEGKIYRTPNTWIQQVRSEFDVYSGELEQTLPAGSWTVEVTAPDGRKWSGNTSITAQSSTDLTLQ